jgi:hypothetical protein
MAFPGMEELLAAAGAQVKEVSFEFAGIKKTIRVRQLTFREAGKMNAKLLNAEGKVSADRIGEYREELLAQTVVGEDDKPAFTKDEIGNMPVALVDAFEKSVRAANGLTETAAADTTKNS